MSSERTSGVAWTSALPFAKRSAFGSTSTRLRLEPTHCLPAGWRREEIVQCGLSLWMYCL
jgi:hypothetical protein